MRLVSYIACIGDRFDPVCQQVVEKLSHRHAYRFVCADWVSPSDGDFRVAWVVDPSVGFERIERWLASGVPVLAPDASQELRAVCNEPPKGLTYLQAEDAEACLHALILDESLHAALRLNALTS